MKSLNLLLFLIVTMMLSSCNQSGKKELSTDLIDNPISADSQNVSDENPKFQFVKTEHDFGKIVDGVRVSFKYKFTNVGTKPLIISQVRTSCGCTASTWTQEPVEPGKSGIVELSFDSSKRKGPNHKMATVIANTQPNSVVLSFTADVVDAQDL